MKLAVPPGPMLIDSRLLIGGEWVAKATGGELDHRYSGTGEIDARVTLAGVEEVNAAVAAATAGVLVWQGLTPEQRRDMLLRLASLVEEHADEFTRIVTLEAGIPTMFAQWNAAGCASYFRYYAGWADKLEGAVIPVSHTSGMGYTHHEPYGVVGLITAWNAPLSFIGTKAAPALAAGNCVVIKPSELAPFSTVRFAELALEAGFPEGVVNVVPGGPEAGDALVRHRGVGKVSFTGSVPTGKKIIEASASTVKPLALELGGKSANIILPDANLEVAVQDAAMVGIGVLSGQGCACGTRILVHESLHEQTMEIMARYIASWGMGDPFDPSTIIGPLVTAASRDRVLGLIDEAKRDQAGQLVIGGGTPGGDLSDGYFVEPTVFDDVPSESRIAQTEIFGPVLAVTKFKDLDEAVQLADATDFGLATFINGRDITTVQKLAARVKSGLVWVNGFKGTTPAMPFGGYGASGYGREGGKAGIDEYLRIKSIFVDHN